MANCQREGCPMRIKGPHFKAEVIWRDGKSGVEKWCEDCAQKLEPNRYVLRYKVEGKKLYMERLKKKNPEAQLKGIGRVNQVEAPIVQGSPEDFITQPNTTKPPPPKSPKPAPAPAPVAMPDDPMSVAQIKAAKELPDDLKPLWAGSGHIEPTIIGNEVPAVENPLPQEEEKEVAPIVESKEEPKSGKDEIPNYFDEVATTS